MFSIIDVEFSIIFLQNMVLRQWKFDIANVNSANSELESVSDLELREILERLNFNIQANLFLEKYQKRKRAFTQWLFPFANQYLGNQAAKIIPKNLNEAVNIYTKEIENLNMMLKQCYNLRF